MSHRIHKSRYHSGPETSKLLGGLPSQLQRNHKNVSFPKQIICYAFSHRSTFMATYGIIVNDLRKRGQDHLAYLSSKLARLQKMRKPGKLRVEKVLAQLTNPRDLDHTFYNIFWHPSLTDLRTDRASKKTPHCLGKFQ